MTFISPKKNFEEITIPRMVTPIYTPFRDKIITDPNSESSVYVESFYPNETFNDRHYKRNGNLIAVLNSYVPVSLDNLAGATFYLNFRNFQGLQAIQPTFIAQREIWPLWGGSILKAEFREFFLTWNPSGGFSSIVNNTWGFAIKKEVTTPVLLFIGRNVETPRLSDYAENIFHIGYESSIPSTVSEAVISLNHGIVQENVNITVVINTAANPLNIKVLQQATPLLGSEVEEFNENPSVFPFVKNYILPEKSVTQTRIKITGGGAGETGFVDVIFNLRPTS